MAIRLIEDDERNEFIFEDSKLIYSRPSPGTKARWTKANTNAKGHINWNKLAEVAIIESVSDWEGVIDSKGNEVEFDKELLRKLPGDVVEEFIAHLDLADPDQASEKKDQPGRTSKST